MQHALGSRQILGELDRVEAFEHRARKRVQEALDRRHRALEELSRIGRVADLVGTFTQEPGPRAAHPQPRFHPVAALV